MSIKENLQRIEKEGMGLSQRLEQKRKLENQKKALLSSKPGSFPPEDIALSYLDSRTSARLIDSGILEILSEAVDFIPNPEYRVTCVPEIKNVNDPLPNGQAYILTLQWDLSNPELLYEDFTWKELGVKLLLDDEGIQVYSACFRIPANHQHTRVTRDFYRQDYFFKLLTLEQWRNRELLESVVADALWKAGVRLPGQHE